MPCYYPAELVIEVFITNGQGNNGKATISMGLGQAPSAFDIQERIAKLEREELAEMDGYRLMTRREMLSYKILEETGQRAHCASPEDFDALEVA